MYFEALVLFLDRMGKKKINTTFCILNSCLNGKTSELKTHQTDFLSKNDPSVLGCVQIQKQVITTS